MNGEDGVDPDKVQEEEEEEEVESPRRCGRLRDDFGLSFFGVEDLNGKVIDIQASFTPKPFLRTLLAKGGIFGWSLSSLIQAIVQTDHGSFFLAYLTHWALLMAIMYMFASLLLTLISLPKGCEQPPDTERPGFLVRFTWGVFPVAAVGEITATLLFWILDYDPDNGVSYVTVMHHGIVMVLLLLEGFIVNSIPVRMKHIIFPMLFGLSYVIWSIIHAATDIGNPNLDDGDPDGDDDAIYGSLNWNERPGGAVVISVLSVLVLMPLEFVGIWCLSRYSFPCVWDGSNRHYCERNSTKVEKEGDVEEQAPTVY